MYQKANLIISCIEIKNIKTICLAFSPVKWFAIFISSVSGGV